MQQTNPTRENLRQLREDKGLDAATIRQQESDARSYSHRLPLVHAEADFREDMPSHVRDSPRSGLLSAVSQQRLLSSRELQRLGLREEGPLPSRIDLGTDDCVFCFLGGARPGRDITVRRTIVIAADVEEFRSNDSAACSFDSGGLHGPGVVIPGGVTRKQWLDQHSHTVPDYRNDTLPEFIATLFGNTRKYVLGDPDYWENRDFPGPQDVRTVTWEVRFETDLSLRGVILAAVCSELEEEDLVELAAGNFAVLSYRAKDGQLDASGSLIGYAQRARQRGTVLEEPGVFGTTNNFVLQYLG